MTNVARQRVFEDSDVLFECAVDANGESPAIVLLYRDDEDEIDDIDLRPRDWAVFDELLEAVAWGEDLPRARHNFLHDGLWELKVGTLRATFYDTDGCGGYTPKLGREVWEAGRGNRRLYDPDEMDPRIRLGHWFVKESQKTPPQELNEARRIREEDLKHDNGIEEATPSVESPDPKAIA